MMANERECAERVALVAALFLCLRPIAYAQDEPAPQPLTIHLFYSPTCPHCHEVRSLTKRLADGSPTLQAVEHNLAEPQNIELMADYYTRYGVPEEQWGGTVALFVGDRWWNDTDKILDELEPAITGMTATGFFGRAGEGGAALLNLFESFGVLTVAAAGLLDGINPCAMATLIFLISYLSFAKRTPKEILATGLLFAAGIFVAYLGVGMGAFRALHELEGISTASKLLYPLMALGTFALAIYSFRDYLRARAGNVGGMTLTLPKPLTRLSHRLVRSSAGPRAFLGFAFIAGLVISILELFCTGQIYLPTLMYVWGKDALRMRAFQLLVLYVGMFTLPIVILTVVAYAGASSAKLTQLAREKTAAVKLGMAILFVALAAYLTSISVALLY